MTRPAGSRASRGVSALDGVRALVTGGASGIGLAIADHLSEHGAQVVTLDREHRLTPEQQVQPLQGAVIADVSDDAEVRGAVAEALKTLGGLDVLVNNAGIGAVGDVSANSDKEWLTVLDVNVVGLVRVTRAALPALRSAARARPGRTSIVNICSIAATQGLVGRALYSASKGAVAALTRAMAADLVADGIRVNAVNPGTVDTPWVERLLAATDDPVTTLSELEARQPTGRLVTAGEVALAVAYLASPWSGSTTGASLAVDGGMNNLRVASSR